MPKFKDPKEIETPKTCSMYKAVEAKAVRPGQWYTGVRGNEVVVVHAYDHDNLPSDIWCFRDQMVEGDCFQYLGDAENFIVSRTLTDDDVPEGWFVSTAHGRSQAKVRRIPRWDARVDDRARLKALLREMVGDHDGKYYLEAITLRMREDPRAPALSPREIARGHEIWTLMLRIRCNDRATDNRLVCDSVDEMPNMRRVE